MAIRPQASARIVTAAILAILFMAACAVRSTPPDVSATQAAPGSSSDPWAAVDDALRSSLTGNLAYTAPAEMTLDEVKAFTLLMSPSASTAELEQALAGVDDIVSASVSVTPRMRAELIDSPPGAFAIQPLHADAEQLLAMSEPTTWEWTVTAREEGRHQLTLIVYRLVTVDGQEYWRQVAYENRIQVNVTLGQRLARLDWQWIVGLIATGLLFPLVRGWARRRGAPKRPAR